MAVEHPVTRTVLAIDTATAAVVAGVVRCHDDARIEVIAERITPEGNAHAELLTPNIVAAVADAAMKLTDLDAVVVGCGPGPFTGLRVGMATAAAYGHALDLPVYGVCSLDAIAAGTTGDVVVITDARRREVYWARYRDGIRTAGPAVNSPADVPAAGAVTKIEFARPTPYGLVAAVGEWTQPGPLLPLYLRRPDAKTLAERAMERSAR